MSLILVPIGFGTIVGWLAIVNWRDRLRIDLIYLGLGFAGVLYLVAWDIFSHQCPVAEVATVGGRRRSCGDGSVVAALVGATMLLVGSVVGRAYADHRWAWMFRTSAK